METITLALNHTKVNKMQTLLNVIGNNDLFVDSYFDYHTNRLKREIAQMKSALEKYEIKYQMQSAEFYTLMEKGELGDDKDFVIWSGIYEFLLDSKKQLTQLIRQINN